MRIVPTVIATLAILGALAGAAFAQETRSYEALNGTFDIPVDPQRIVALNDHVVGLPLIEMGAPLVGAAGRVDGEGNHFMRGGMDTLGVDFANSDIAFIGTFNGLDVEAIAALDPDVIIGGLYTDAATAEQLQKIAPTLIIDNNSLGFLGMIEALADIAGKSGTFDARYERYRANLVRARGFVGDPAEISVTLTFMFPAGDQLWVYKDGGLGAISQVVSDMGFAQSEAVAAMSEPVTSVSRELIQGLDADYVFGFYRQQPDATPGAVFAAYETFAQGWCLALTACQDGQFILLPAPAFGNTMQSLDLALELVESHMAGRRSGSPRMGAE